jgi:GntR family transcriptional regulator, transcriptional repressor for pyruvate dehydrogenase complex
MDVTRPAGRGSGLRLSQQVKDDLLARMSAGEFRPGDKLPGEVELMAYYQVGRNTVREAIQGLVALGAIDVRPRRGATVLAVTPRRALPVEVLSNLLSTRVTEDLYDMRLLLETEAASRAATRRDPEALAEIRHHHSIFEYQMRHDIPPWKPDLEFHYAIARASGNSVLPIMLEAAADLLAKDRRAAAEVREGALEETYQQHSAILAAIEAGDHLLARERMDAHIRTASGYVRELRERARRRRERSSGAEPPLPGA